MSFLMVFLRACAELSRQGWFFHNAVKSDGKGTHRTLQQACMKWIPASAATVISKVGMPGG